MTIPLVDAHEVDFGDALLDACRDIGFVTVTGHGIDRSLFERMRELLVRLFDVDDATKAAHAITRNDYRGFIPLGFFTPHRRDVTGDAADMYEGYKLHWECPPDHPARAACPLYGSNRWADHVPDMAPTVLEYWAACDRFAATLLDLFAGAIGLSPEALRAMFDAPLTNMTLLHYPPHAPDTGTVGIHPHKDTNVVTFLHPDPVGGLEVRAADGSWIEVEAPSDALVVNIGEMLELWSGGEFPATPHRVINRSGAERYSFPWFLVPNHSVVVEPIRPIAGVSASPMPVGELSAEVWRTNWPDESPAADRFDLGTLDR